METKNSTSDIEQELISIKTVCKIVGLSQRTIWRMNDEGRIPSSIRLGKSVKWRRKEINEWISAGCPNRDKWNEIYNNPCLN